MGAFQRQRTKPASQPTNPSQPASQPASRLPHEPLSAAACRCARANSSAWAILDASRSACSVEICCSSDWILVSSSFARFAASARRRSVMVFSALVVAASAAASIWDGKLCRSSVVVVSLALNAVLVSCKRLHHTHTHMHQLGEARLMRQVHGIQLIPGSRKLLGTVGN